MEGTSGDELIVGLHKTCPGVRAAVRRVNADERWIPPYIAQQLADRVARDQFESP